MAQTGIEHAHSAVTKNPNTAFHELVMKAGKI